MRRAKGEPPPGPGDAELVASIRAGDGEAMRTLYERYRDMVFRKCYRILQHHQDAEDAVQIVFIEVLRYIDRLAPRPSLSWWLKRVCIGSCERATNGRHRSKRLKVTVNALATELAEAKGPQPIDVAAQREAVEQWRADKARREAENRRVAAVDAATGAGV